MRGLQHVVLALAVLQLAAAGAPAPTSASEQEAGDVGPRGAAVALHSASTAVTVPSMQPAQPPSVCAAMLSYNRPHYLIPAARAFVAYMAAVEPGVSWTLQILDNGSGPKALANITQQLAPLRAAGHAVRLVHLERNIGLSRGFNLLFLDMCASTGASYILSLEDDWRARTEVWPAAFPVLQASMQALQRHDTLLEVWLRDHHQNFTFNKPAEWQVENFSLPAANHPTAMADQQLQLHVLHMACINERGNPWGGYSNGASIKHAQRLQQLGRMPGTDGEAAISKRACRKGLHVAYICQDTSCFEPVKQWHDGLFEHLGTARVPASMDARSNKKAVARKGLFSGRDTLANLKHILLISSTGSDSSSTRCDGASASAAALAAASSSGSIGLQLQQQQLLLSQPATLVWQHGKSNSSKVWLAMMLVVLAASAVLWYGAVRGRGLMRKGHWTRASAV